MQSSIEDQIPFSSQEMSHQNKCSSVTRWFYRRLLLLWALALVQGDRLKYHHWSLGVLGFRVCGSVSSLPGEKKKGKNSAGRNGFDLHRQSWTSISPWLGARECCRVLMKFT